MNHNTSPLDESRKALESSLKEQISSLEECQEALEKMPQDAEEIIREAKSRIRETINLVNKSFASIREAADKKEKEVLEHLERKEGGEDDVRKTITSAQKLRAELPSILKDARALLGEWKDTALTAEVVSKIFGLREKTASGQAITKELNGIENWETVISTEDFTKGIKRGLADIDAIQVIPLKRVSRIPSTEIILKRISSTFAVITWDIKNEQDRYAVSIRKDGGRWNDSTPDNIGPRNYYVMYPLEPETKYEFRVMTRRNGVKSQWSEVHGVKTIARNPIDYIEKEVEFLNSKYGKPDLCEASFDKLLKWLKRGKF